MSASSFLNPQMMRVRPAMRVAMDSAMVGRESAGIGQGGYTNPSPMR